MTDDIVVLHYKGLQGNLQDAIRAYYEGNINEALDALDLAYQRMNGMRYSLFQTTHTSGSKG